MKTIAALLALTLASAPLFGAVKENEIVKDPVLRELFHATVTQGHFDSHGATGTNKRFERGDHDVPRFDVGTQRNALGPVARGIAEGDPSFIDLGIRAMDYAFDHQDPKQGTFGESGYAETAAFVAFAARAYYMIQDSPYASQYQEKLRSYVPKLDKAGHWLADPNNSVRRAWYARRADNANQVAAAGFALAMLGKLTGNKDYSVQGDKYIEHVLDIQQDNGIFPEFNSQTDTKGGDTNYQVVTLDVLDWYEIYFPDSRLSSRIQKALDKGWAWEKGFITDTGEIRDTGNVRTGRGGEHDYFGKKKDISYPMIIIALVYRSHIANDTQAAHMAEAVYRYAVKLYKEHRLG